MCAGLWGRREGRVAGALPSKYALALTGNYFSENHCDWQDLQAH